MYFATGRFEALSISISSASPLSFQRAVAARLAISRRRSLVRLAALFLPPSEAWDHGTTYEFVSDVRARTRGRMQITTDGFKAYFPAIDDAFGADVDYAYLVKTYGTTDPDRSTYSPSRITAIFHQEMFGRPDPELISTSYVERQNLTMRMQMRRFTRLTNAFSKKLENLKAAVALHFAWYNFVRVHSSLRVTPAMEAGLSDHVWTIGELLA